METLIVIIGIVWIIGRIARSRPRLVRRRISYSMPGQLQSPAQAEQQEAAAARWTRREAEREQRRLDQERQRAATMTANESKARQLMMLAEQYTDYVQALREELDDPNTSLSRMNQVRKEILRAQEKAVRLVSESDKAYYQSRAYFDAE